MIGRRRRTHAIEFAVLLMLMFAYAGDPPPMVNEAHYLVKAKNFWNPAWCQNDLFAASGKAHTTYYATFGLLTQWFSLPTSAWICRWIGWMALAAGLMQFCRALTLARFASCIVLVVWIAGIEHGNLAGEWVLGGTEAKVPAYALVLFGLAAMARRRWNAVWICFGAAAAFHVLVGGWSVLAGVLSWVWNERVQTRLQTDEERAGKRDRVSFWTVGLFIGGGLSMLGLLPAMWLTSQADAAVSLAAAKTYVFFRIPHHLLPSSFPIDWYLRHGVLIALTALLYAWLVRHGRLESQDRKMWMRIGWFVAGTVLIAVVGLAIDFAPVLDRNAVARLLRYYWFRMTDVGVPLLLGCLVAMQATSLTGSLANRARAIAAYTVLILCGYWFAASAITSSSLPVPPSHSNRLLGWDADASAEQQQKVFADWLKVCDYIRNCTPADEVFLTPRHQQTFKWYAERAEVVNFKDVPQDATSLLQWSNRFREVFPQSLGTMRVTIQYAKLREYRKKHGVRFMIVDRRIAGQNLPLIRLYPLDPETNDTYAVYELPPETPKPRGTPKPPGPSG